jgi:hypothetical protein
MIEKKRRKKEERQTIKLETEIQDVEDVVKEEVIVEANEVIEEATMISSLTTE